MPLDVPNVISLQGLLSEYIDDLVVKHGAKGQEGRIVSCWVYTIRQEHDIEPLLGIDPHRGTGETGMTKGSR